MNSRAFSSAQHRSSRPRRTSGWACTYLTARSRSIAVGTRENAARYSSVTASAGVALRSISLATRPLPFAILASMAGDIDKCKTCGKFALALAGFLAKNQVPQERATLLVKAKESPAALVASVKEALASVDPGRPVAQNAVLDDVVNDSLRQPRFTSALVGTFALVAAFLAALGLFGLLSYSVKQRLPEMGIRLALGARPRDIAGMILREGAALAAAGAAVGLLGALALSELLTRLLYETSPRDPVAFAGVSAFVFLLAFLAAALPAHRASRANPAVALRSE